MPDEKPQSTIDERLEALTMTLELVARDTQELKAAAQRDRERIRALTEDVRTLTGMVRKDGEDIRALTAAMVQQDTENIRALARIAGIHEHRLTDLEK